MIGIASDMRRFIKPLSASHRRASPCASVYTVAIAANSADTKTSLGQFSEPYSWLLENGSSTLLPEKEDSTNVVVFREPGEPQVGTYEYLTSSKDTILNWDATGSIAG